MQAKTRKPRAKAVAAPEPLAVQLLSEHIHHGTRHAAGAVLHVHPSVAQWLIGHGIAKVQAQT